MFFYKDLQVVVLGEEVINLFKAFLSYLGIKLVVNSGWDCIIFENWLGYLGLDMVVEYGVWMKCDGKW